MVEVVIAARGHNRRIGVAEPRCGLDDRLEDGLQLRRCTTDNAQDLARRGLVLEGLLQLARARLDLFEETSVLDRDHCLVREGLEESDLLVGKGSHLGTTDCDRSYCLVLAHQRRRQDGSNAETPRHGLPVRELVGGSLTGRVHEPACGRRRRVPSPSRVQSEEARSQPQSTRDAPRP